MAKPYPPDGESTPTAKIIHQDPKDGKWYFWVEDWSSREGPFESEKECREVFDGYLSTL